MQDNAVTISTEQLQSMSMQCSVPSRQHIKIPVHIACGGPTCTSALTLAYHCPE